MKRTDADEHDSNLFQDEDLPTTAGTLLEETWLNNVQEELARAIEYAGQNLSGSIYYQLALALNRWGPADLFRVDAGTAGPFVPQNPQGTFWVTPISGRDGKIEAGSGTPPAATSPRP